MTATRKSLGAFGEAYARGYLARRGYRIIESNVRLPIGEIDIVASDGDTLVFVEVRTRRSRRLGTPEESVTRRKAQRLLALAQQYLQRHGGPDQTWRIDVVAVEVGGDGRVTRAEVYQNAVEGS